MTRPRRSSPGRVRTPPKRQVVRLAPAPGEDDLGRLGAHERGNLLPGLLDRGTGALTEPVEAGRVPVTLAEEWQHPLEDRGVQGRRGRVVEIDSRHYRPEPARLQDQAGLEVLELGGEAHRVLVRVHEPLDARVEPLELGRGSLADRTERWHLVDHPSGAYDRHEQIGAGGPRPDALAAGGVHGIDDDRLVGQALLLVVDDVGQEALGGLEAPHLLDPGGGRLHRLLGDLDAVLPRLSGPTHRGQLVHPAEG